MVVELRPLGVKCNIQCHYCYQNPQRNAGNIRHDYDLAKMKAAIEREGGPFSLFGGEALMVPERDLEDLWAWGFRKFGYNSIQTNGSLINDKHIRLFRDYKVHVGVSIDGPGEFNDVRWAGSLEKTREATAKTERAIEWLCREGMAPSLIITLHRGNGTRNKLPTMHEWLRRLERMGVRSARLHVLEVDDEGVREKYALSIDENVEAFLSFLRLSFQLKQLKFDVFDEMRALLQGEDKASCVWHACDPYTTASVRGVEGNGQASNCGRTNKDGIDFVKASAPGFERYLALYNTPQEHGGCKGCRFFLMCKGECPGTAIGGDWRNRTEHCELWKRVFAVLEQELLREGVVPLSLAPARAFVEEKLVEGWAEGENLSLATAVTRLAAPTGALPR